MRVWRVGAALALLATCTATALAGPASAPPVRPARGWCEARPNAAWKRALAQGVVGLSRTTSIVPLADGRDGRSFFASVYSDEFSGVARIDAASGAVLRIRAFPDPENDQATGNFDGRWFVWREDRSLENWFEFSLFAWDSRTRQVMHIGDAQQAPDGSYWPSTWRGPEVRAGVATWEQGSGQDHGEVHLVDLVSGRDRVVGRGLYAQGSFLLGAHMVVWAESPRRGALPVMQAADSRTGAAVSVPASLRGLRGIWALMTDGIAIAYPDTSFRSLWWSPRLDTPPLRLVSTMRHDEHIDNSVQVAGRYVLFGVGPHAYLADTRAKRYLEISPGGFGRLSAHGLVFLKPSRVKANHAVTDVLFLPLRALPPIPGCR